MDTKSSFKRRTFAEMVSKQKEEHERERKAFPNSVFRFQRDASRDEWLDFMRFPSDFNSTGYDITVEIFDSTLDSNYRIFTGMDQEVNVRFCIQYNGSTFTLWVNQESPYENPQHIYKYTSKDREKILAKIIQHSNFRQDKLQMQMGIHPSLDYDVGENVEFPHVDNLEFDLIEMPFDLYCKVITHFVHEAYPTDAEEKAKQERENKPIPSYKSVIHRIHL